MRQLILDLPMRQARGREDFFVSPANAVAVAAIDAASTWPSGRLLIIGPMGAGKSHLAAIWATGTDAVIIAARGLHQTDIGALMHHPAIVVEDAHTIAGQHIAQNRLFHLCNAVQAEGGRLMLTANAPPRDWGLTLPDLSSRLEATTLVRLSAPDDRLLAAVLVKLFNDRQTKVPHSLIPWLVARMDRSLAAAQTLVAALDARAVAEGRPLTRAMAAEIMT